MLRLGSVALIVTLTFLVSQSHSNAALGVGPSVAAGGRDKGVVEPVHYSGRYGWHCGMRNYGHEHRDACQCRREGGYWSDSDRSRYGAWQRRLFGAGGRPVES